MYFSPTTGAVIQVLLNTTIFITWFIIGRKISEYNTKKKVLNAILKKVMYLESKIDEEINSKEHGEVGHYARMRNEKRTYCSQHLAELAEEISKL